MMRISPRSLPRLPWLYAAVLALVSACQSPPPVARQPVVDEQARRAQVLQDQGFVQDGDDWELQMSGKLLFDFNSDAVASQQRETLLQMGRALVDVGVKKLRVEGHADDRGTASYNERLSLRRAQVVADVLVEAGIPRENIELHGYGATLPLEHGTSEAARKENRRVALIIPAQ